jgi:ABC-type multidrug transport system ATPase subunit
MTDTNPLIRTVAAIPMDKEKSTLIPLTCEINSASLVCFLGQRFSILNIYLRMLAGLTQPQSGEIEHFVSEQTTPAHSHFPSIAYLNYNSTLLSILNGFENVLVPALYHQLGSRECIEQQAHALLSELNYNANHTLLPTFMSMLQRKHLLIVRALMLKPQIVFIENPFSGLELEEITILGQYLGELVKNKNITIVTSNANLDFVEQYAHHIIYAAEHDFHFFKQWQDFLAYKQLNQLKF